MRASEANVSVGISNTVIGHKYMYTSMSKYLVLDTDDRKDICG